MKTVKDHFLVLEYLENRILPYVSAFDIIGLPAEQEDYTFRGNGVNIAVIDSGADLSQSYVKGAVNIIDPTASAADGYGHGSFVASEIHEVAPNAGIYSVKVLNDKGSGYTTDGEKGFQWVIDHYRSLGISVVNYSIAYVGDDLIIDRDIEQLVKDGVTVCIAAGNSQASDPNILNSATDSSVVISVGATWVNYLINVTFDGATDYHTYVDKIAAYSQRSANLSLLAPGDVQVGNSGWTGTSMSAALVSGAVALVHEALVSQNRIADESTILSVLQNTGKPIEDSATPADNVQHTGLTFKRIDVDAAIRSILPPQHQSSPPTPTPQPPPMPSNETFVTSLYEHVLNRQPDAGGLSFWSNLLAKGDSRADVALRIWRSDEHLHHYASLTAEQLYESLLGRDGDTGGLAYFEQKPEDVVAVTMLASEEFFEKSA